MSFIISLIGELVELVNLGFHTFSFVFVHVSLSLKGVKQGLEGNPEILISYASLGNWVSLDAGFLQSFKFELQVVFGFGDCHG